MATRKNLKKIGKKIKSRRRVGSKKRKTVRGGVFGFGREARIAPANSITPEDWFEQSPNAYEKYRSAYDNVSRLDDRKEYENLKGMFKTQTFQEDLKKYLSTLSEEEFKEKIKILSYQDLYDLDFMESIKRNV